MIVATDCDTGDKRTLFCPTCRNHLGIDPDENDIGHLRCDVHPEHLWRLSTVMERQ